MISIQWISKQLAVFSLPGKDSPRVSNVGTEYLVADDEDGDAGGAAEVDVDARLRVEVLAGRLERLGERVLDLVGVDHALLGLGLVEDVLDLFLHVDRQLESDVLGDFFPVESVAVTD